jgi:hypothetical protein
VAPNGAWAWRLGAAIAVAATAAGCFVEANDPAPPPVIDPSARLTVRWTVDEAVDPNLCVMGRAAAIDITVNAPSGQLAGEFQGACTSFATTISQLYPGNYGGQAVLIDSAGRDRTTTIDIRPFTVVARSELVIDVDFPADSFLDSLDRELLKQLHDGGASPAGAVHNETR